MPRNHRAESAVDARTANQISLARSVAPCDTSTSIVITPPTGPQIKTGALSVSTYADIVYATRAGADGNDRALCLDLLVPQGPGAKPLVVYVPGGGFVVCQKEMALERRTFVAEAGYAVASIEYRTVHDGATYRDVVADVKSAIRFLRAHGPEYGIDPAKIAVWGESAGGYLAAMAGVTDTTAGLDTPDNADFSGNVDAVIDFFGIADLRERAADFDEDTQQDYLRPGSPTAAFVFGQGTDKSLADEPAAVAAADPAQYVTATTPPFLLFHGSADNAVSPSQTLTLHNVLREHGVESTRYLLTGAGHGDIAVILAGLEDELPPGVAVDDLVAAVGGIEGALPWTTQELLGYAIMFLAKHLHS
jgi:acetyl esterase/lipase